MRCPRRAIWRLPALAALEKVVVDPKQATAKRESALDTLLFQQRADLVPVLQGLLADKDMRGAAIRGLARFDNPQTPALLLKRYATLSDTEKADAIHTLTSRPEYARALLNAIAAKQMCAAMSPPSTPGKYKHLGNKEVTEALAKVWGTIRPASTVKAGLMKKYKSALTADYLRARICRMAAPFIKRAVPPATDSSAKAAPSAPN